MLAITQLPRCRILETLAVTGEKLLLTGKSLIIHIRPKAVCEKFPECTFKSREPKKDFLCLTIEERLEGRLSRASAGSVFLGVKEEKRLNTIAA